jgi:hypothetical protein
MTKGPAKRELKILQLVPLASMRHRPLSKRPARELNLLPLCVRTVCQKRLLKHHPLSHHALTGDLGHGR